MPSTKNLKRNVERRQKEALERKTARDLLTPAQQLAKLDTLPPPRNAAVRERKRLQALLTPQSGESPKEPKKAHQKAPRKS